MIGIKTHTSGDVWAGIILSVIITTFLICAIVATWHENVYRGLARSTVPGAMFAENPGNLASWETKPGRYFIVDGPNGELVLVRVHNWAAEIVESSTVRERRESR